MTKTTAHSAAAPAVRAIISPFTLNRLARFAPATFLYGIGRPSSAISTAPTR